MLCKLYHKSIISLQSVYFLLIDQFVFCLILCQVPALQETMDLLCLPPDRIGHGTCLHPEAGGTQEFVDTVLTHKTPLGTVKYQCIVGQLIEHKTPLAMSQVYKYQHTTQNPTGYCLDSSSINVPLLINSTQNSTALLFYKPGCRKFFHSPAPCTFIHVSHVQAFG